MSEPVGSAAEEAARLFAALEGWARTRFDGEHLASGTAECTVCPVCQAIAAARQVGPDTVTHLLDAAASFVAALRTVLAPGPEDGPPRRTPGVQHVDVREG